MKSRRWEHLLSLGSNVEPDRWVPRALALARARFEVTGVSALYDVPAVGGSAGTPVFVNLAIRLRTDLPPAALRVVCRHVEEACGRVRRADRFAPRTLDLDVVYSLAPGGTGPGAHPDLAREAYVLVPAADVWPDATLPHEGRTVTLAGRAAAMFPGWRERHRRREERA